MKIITPALILAILVFGCNDQNDNTEHNNKIIALQNELDSLKSSFNDIDVDDKSKISTFLTFQENNAEEAMNFYVGLFENSRIIDVQRYGKDGPAKEGSIFVATFELNGSKFACSDSYIKHDWDFTPGISIWVECDTKDEIETLFEQLSENGNILMPINNYGWSQSFAFVEDQFGVSWQLNLK